MVESAAERFQMFLEEGQCNDGDRVRYDMHRIRVGWQGGRVVLRRRGPEKGHAFSLRIGQIGQAEI